jgi:hypothetical protein
MTPTLEDRIREVFETDAVDAPVGQATWTGPTIGVTAKVEPLRRPMLRWSLAAAVVAALIGTAYFVQRPDDSPATAWQPVGTEYRLTDLGPATSTSNHVTTAGLSRAIQIPGQPITTITRTIDYSFGPTAEEQRCVDSGGGGGCAPKWTWGRQPDVSVSSSVDNRVASEDSWMWNGLPAGTAYVEFTDGNRHLWQRPVAGFSAFPNVTGASEVATAYSFDGTVLGRASFNSPASQPDDGVAAPMQADVSTSQYAELQLLTTTTMRDCLTAAGAVWGSETVATFAAGADDRSIWDGCVASTKQVVGNRVSAMGVRMYDPSTETAENPDSPIQRVDPSNCHPLASKPGVTECSSPGPITPP